MNPKANAILLQAKTKAVEVKASRYKTEKCKPYTKEEVEQVRVALVDASNGWSGVKRECVLLKRKG